MVILINIKTTCTFTMHAQKQEEVEFTIARDKLHLSASLNVVEAGCHLSTCMPSQNQPAVAVNNKETLSFTVLQSPGLSRQSHSQRYLSELGGLTKNKTLAWCVLNDIIAALHQLLPNNVWVTHIMQKSLFQTFSPILCSLIVMCCWLAMHAISAAADLCRSICILFFSHDTVTLHLPDRKTQQSFKLHPG